MDLRVGLAVGAPWVYACGAVRSVLPTLSVSKEEEGVCDDIINVCNGRGSGAQVLQKMVLRAMPDIDVSPEGLARQYSATHFNSPSRSLTS
jgi:hypothetical protein